RCQQEGRGCGLGGSGGGWVEGDVAKRMIGRQLARQVADDVLYLVGELDRAAIAAAAHRIRRAHVAAGRTAYAEIDAPRKERLEHAEHLGDLEGAVVGQHDAAGTDAELARRRRDAR